jgi:hypothetical protein
MQVAEPLGPCAERQSLHNILRTPEVECFEISVAMRSASILVQPVRPSSKACTNSVSATFIFRRVCRAFGVVERYVRFPDNLSLLIYPTPHCLYCAGLFCA